MPSYKFTDKAEADLEDIIDYTVEQWGSVQAIKYVDTLEELAQTLADNPKLGRNRDIFISGLLSFNYESHVLYYVEEPHGITVLRVLHKRMDEQKQFKV